MRRRPLVLSISLLALCACGDDDAPDAGFPAPDTGARDAGRRDLGLREDAAVRDLGTSDGGEAEDGGLAEDTGTLDLGLADAEEPTDSGEPIDSGPVDTGPSCLDGIRNGDETWVDCGGWCNILCPPCPNTGNLLRNPSFENISVPGTGQGLLPSDWVIVNPSPDTFSNDGSFGLPPEGFGNFNGVVASDGIRWVAGWNSAQEIFGQVLSSTLTPGVRYRLEGRLHRAMRVDLQAHGTYVVALANGLNRAQTAELGRFAYTSSVAWQPRMFEFVAPEDAELLPLIYFVPTSTIGSSYPGIDALELVQTTSCAR